MLPQIRTNEDRRRGNVSGLESKGVNQPPPFYHGSALIVPTPSRRARRTIVEVVQAELPAGYRRSFVADALQEQLAAAARCGWCGHQGLGLWHYRLAQPNPERGLAPYVAFAACGSCGAAVAW